MKQIDMTSNQYVSLINICRSNKLEISGTIDVKQTENDYFVTDIKIDNEKMILDSSRKHIEFNNIEYTSKIVYEILCSGKNMCVRFHTHPGRFGACKLSLADFNGLKENQKMANRIKENVIISECIVTRDEVAFYYYDALEGKLNRLPLYVDGVEKVPIEEKYEGKSFFQILKNGFNEGIIEVRKR